MTWNQTQAYKEIIKPVVLCTPDGNVIPTGSIENALTTIDYFHFQVWEGNLYISSYITPDASPIADNGNLDILFIVGTSSTPLSFRLAAGGDAEFYLYENPIISNNGTNLERVNMNRTSANVSLDFVYYTPTVTNVGTLLTEGFLPGQILGSIEGPTLAEGFIFKSETTYLLRGINREGSAQQMGWTLKWYEA